MARLAFYDYHNMIAILEKYEHNVDFHQIVDFVEASHIMYALTINPTVYVSHIRQFWSTARVETSDDETKILTSVDEIYFSKRSVLPSVEVSNPYHYAMLKSKKYRVNSPSFSGRTVPLFDTMMVHQGEGSGTPTEPHHTPSPEAPQSPQHDLSSSIHPPVTTITIPTVIPSDNPPPPLRQYSRRARIAQSSAFPTAVDEHASPLEDDSQGEACPTVSGLEAKQDRANIIKISTLPYDSPLRVTSLAADEGTQDLEIASLKARIKLLEDKDGGGDEPSGKDATIKGRSLEIREEADVEKSTERGKVPTVSVPTGSGMVPTASPMFTTASVVTPYSRRNGKEKMVESDTPKKKRLQEQIDIARDAEIARIHAEEELQILIDSLDRNNKIVVKYLQEYEQFAADLSIKERIELINDLKHIEDFVPMGSKEEGERFKRKGLRLEQESAKKVKTSEEVSEEDLKIMMQLMVVEEVYVEALQVKHLIIDWEIHTEG
uniref:Xylulose kinase-1 n=1 Tax=Tanacetum cinerariifolium TaxID=118510 RepID=A0A699I3C5_TANCI|nr:hypothetical protein [Tanacetum cinerariifolium]